MRKMFVYAMMCLSVTIFSQEEMENNFQNSTDKMLSTAGNLTIGGYGEVHYNQPYNSDIRQIGELDVHRMVMLFGYRFNERTQFVTELEFEHVKEVYVEQAFLQYKINRFINFRGGLILTPMGIINEYHEPTTFNGVERPLLDNRIAPTTWREIGFGFTGNILQANIKYQGYVVNGFNGFDGEGNLGGKSGLRGGRQKGAESFMSSPNFTGKIEYYGIRGLNIGFSGYLGQTQSSLYDGVDKNDNEAMAGADSSVVGITMFGADGRYTFDAMQFRAQFYYSLLSNTDQYNELTGSDLGSSMLGYYIEAGINVFKYFEYESELIPFLRYSQYNLHQSMENNVTANPAYNNEIITSGLTWKMDKGAVLKADIQLVKSEADSEYKKVFSAGLGVMF